MRLAVRGGSYLRLELRLDRIKRQGSRSKRDGEDLEQEAA